jgi:hypothetical protein
MAFRPGLNDGICGSVFSPQADVIGTIATTSLSLANFSI